MVNTGRGGKFGGRYMEKNLRGTLNKRLRIGKSAGWRRVRGFIPAPPHPAPCRKGSRRAKKPGFPRAPLSRVGHCRVTALTLRKQKRNERFPLLRMPVQVVVYPYKACGASSVWYLQKIALRDWCRSYIVPRVLDMPTWRNWQTRWTQNPVPARACGFDSLRRHFAPSAHVKSFNG